MRVVLAGAHGYGAHHLRNIARLAHAGQVQLVGVCDPRPLGAQARRLAGRAPYAPSLEELLDGTRPDITVISTPIHTHVPLALAAVAAGSHVLLEKPPAVTLDDFSTLLDAQERAGVAVQVGFQSFGSASLPHLRALLVTGRLGELRGIGAAGAWVRDASYYARTPWAGARTLEGEPVIDGALTNPFAHATATALRLDGSDRLGEARLIEPELFRANPIAADDTSSVRIVTARGTPIVVSVTLCAAADADPYVVAHGSAGVARLYYKTHVVELETSAGTERSQHGCADLLENLVAHAAGEAAELIAPLERTGAFMQVLERVRTGPEPRRIPDAFVRVDGDGSATRRIVPGVDEAVRRSAAELKTFTELGLPWTQPVGVGAAPKEVP